MSSDQNAVAFLTAGGEAPGHNAVLEAALKAASVVNMKFLGVKHGFQGLLEDTPEAEWLDPAGFLGIGQMHGGTILGASRQSLAKDAERPQIVARKLQQLGVNMIIAAGGDDTRRSLDCLLAAAATLGIPLQGCHAAKTIDRDFPLPGGVPTYGFETAARQAALNLEPYLDNARADGKRFFLLEGMGRHAGHLAVQTARNVEAYGRGTPVLQNGRAIMMKYSIPYCFIPEMFPSGLTLEQLVEIIVAAAERSLADRVTPEGMILAEGLYDVLDDASKAKFEKAGSDDHGHVELASIPFVQPLVNRVTPALKKAEVKLSVRSGLFGYDVRTVAPIPEDSARCEAIGRGAITYLYSGRSGATIYADANYRAAELESGNIPRDPDGKIKIDVVDLESGPHVEYLTPSLEVVRQVMGG